METLNYEVLKKSGYDGYVLKDAPEKVLQFGEGNFLRAFVDYWFDLANEKADWNGKCVLVQPIAPGLAKMINEQEGLYTLYLRGSENGQKVDDKRVISSVSRCLNPYEKADYEKMMDVAASDDLEIIVSNTTEAGIVYDPACQQNDCPPSSFPAKLTQVLYHRYKAGKKGIIMLACELIDNNGANLKRIVLQYAREWELSQEFLCWVEEDNHFCSTLVDRIVTGYPRDQLDYFAEKLGYEDQCLVTSEVFNLWVIEGKQEWSEILPIHKTDAHVVWTNNVTPYKKRKVRILNGGHTASVLAAYLSGHDIVLEMMNDPVFVQYLDKLLFQEVIPTLDLPKDELMEFAAAVKDRFRNPYIKHRLLDISLNSCSKWCARVMPSLLGYVAEKGQLPTILTFSLAAFIKFYQGKMIDGVYTGTRTDGTNYPIKDDAEVPSFFCDLWDKGNPEEIATAVLSNTAFWDGHDLSQVPGLTDAVSGYLVEMDQRPVRDVVASLL